MQWGREQKGALVAEQQTHNWNVDSTIQAILRADYLSEETKNRLLQKIGPHCNSSQEQSNLCIHKRC